MITFLFQGIIVEIWKKRLEVFLIGLFLSRKIHGILRKFSIIFSNTFQYWFMRNLNFFFRKKIWNFEEFFQVVVQKNFFQIFMFLPWTFLKRKQKINYCLKWKWKILKVFVIFFKTCTRKNFVKISNNITDNLCGSLRNLSKILNEKI